MTTKYNEWASVEPPVAVGIAYFGGPKLPAITLKLAGKIKRAADDIRRG